jgi:hypothetical protein
MVLDLVCPANLLGALSQIALENWSARQDSNLRPTA